MVRILPGFQNRKKDQTERQFLYMKMLPYPPPPRKNKEEEEERCFLFGWELKRRRQLA